MRLGYKHHRTAAFPETGRMPMLALLVADITNPSNFDVIRGAEAQARAAGYTLVLGDTQENPEFEKAHAERLMPAVEGFVLAGSRLPDADLLELAEQQPVVLLNRQVASLPSVVTDSADAAGRSSRTSRRSATGPSPTWAVRPTPGPTARAGARSRHPPSRRASQ